jgi:ribosome maturation protein SDO1
MQILKKGELQVSEKERSQVQDAICRDIATILSEKCVNPETKRPYPVTMIEKAMKELSISIHPTKPAKVQAFSLLKKMEQVFPIERARMRIQVMVPIKESKKLKGQVKPLFSTIQEETHSMQEWNVTGLIDPGSYKVIFDMLQSETAGNGRVDVLDLYDVVESDEEL